MKRRPGGRRCGAGSQRLAEAACVCLACGVKKIASNGLHLADKGRSIPSSKAFRVKLRPYMTATWLKVEPQEDLAGAAAAEVGTARR